MPTLFTVIQQEMPVVSLLATLCGVPAEPTGVDRELYLDLPERIVRTAQPWQREDGLIIDPATGAEAVSTTPRYVGALGQLIGAGRCLDLLESCALAMDACCDGFATGTFDGKPFAGGEFYIKELMYALEFLDGKVDADRHARWRQALSEFDPMARYSSIAGRATHNWPIYAIAGEVLKMRDGLADHSALIDECLAIQRPQFTEIGMYRDPNDPITYDLTVRHQLGLMLTWGYDGEHATWVDDAVRKGALAGLFTQSATGQVPFGGRSNQFHFQEAMFAGICEMEARRWLAKGRPEIAGAYKRAARRAAMVTRRWILDMDPFRQTKNAFAPLARHGVDSGGEYSCYGLLAASCFATAWHVADESIEERLTPAEVGGFVRELAPAFHKVFATCGGYHIEIDTRAEVGKDATGLGRLQKIGAPSEIALGMPIPGKPAYSIGVGAPAHSLAIGPGWLDADGNERRLAEVSPEIDDVTVDVIREDADRVEFTVTYTGDFAGVDTIVETYALSAEGLTYSSELSPTPSVTWLSVPILATDGENEPDVDVQANALQVSYLGSAYSVQSSGAITISDTAPMPNRNALYREARINALSATLTIR